MFCLKGKSMSEKGSNVNAIVEEYLGKFVKSYEVKKEDFLTECDVASSLFCILKDEMEKASVEGYKIHGGLRPCIGLKPCIKEEDIKVLTYDSVSSEWKWEKQNKAKNSGAVVDIVVVNSDQKYLRWAEEISPKKYCRLVTFPIEAFAVCVEVKIRVSGNIKRIKEDIEKLSKIKEANSNCLVYLVVVDRKATKESKSIKHIKKLCDENSVLLYIYPHSINQT